MTTTLTQRYIAATVKSLSPAAQVDVRAELEASIADAIEGRVEQGEKREDAERTVLTELGDPAVLAAGYADRPLHLIGPRYYVTWWRLVKLLLMIVPVCVVGGVALGQTLSGAPIGTIIGQSIAAGLSSIVYVCFWVTLVFAVLERTGADMGLQWDVDQLPEPQPTGVGRADLIAQLVLLGLAAGAVLWDQFRGFVRTDGESLPLLSPELWPYLIALIGLEAVFVIVLYVRGRWSTALAVTSTALAVLFMSLVLTLLVRGELFNPEFVEVFGAVSGLGQDTLRTLAILLGFSVAGISVWDIVDGWLKKHRDGR